MEVKIDTEGVVSLTEANQNFSRVARIADTVGQVVILKNNKPRYLLIDFSRVEKEQAAADEDVAEISKRLMERNRTAYEVLAK